MRTSAKFAIQVVLSIAVSGAFIAFSLRHTDLAAVGRAMAASNPLPVLGYFAILLVVHMIKTLRWELLLRPLGSVSFRRLNSAAAVGFMLMVALPLRLGELARPLLVSRPSPGDDARLPRAAAMASILVERAIDSLAVGALGILSLRYLAPTNQAAQLVRRAAMLMTLAFGAMCVALVVAYFMRERAVALVRLALQPLSRALAERAAHLIDRFIGGMQLGSGRDVLGVLLLTAAYWGLQVCGFWLVARGFDLPLTPMMAGTVLACQIVGLMIPAGPGMVGTSQFFTQLGLSIFIPESTAIAELAARAAGYANTVWLVQFGQTVLTGLLFLGLGHVSLRGLFDHWEGDPMAAEKAVST